MEYNDEMNNEDENPYLKKGLLNNRRRNLKLDSILYEKYLRLEALKTLLPSLHPNNNSAVRRVANSNRGNDPDCTGNSAIYHVNTISYPFKTSVHAGTSAVYPDDVNTSQNDEVTNIEHEKRFPRSGKREYFRPRPQTDQVRSGGKRNQMIWHDYDSLYAELDDRLTADEDINCLTESVLQTKITTLEMLGENQIEKLKICMQKIEELEVKMRINDEIECTERVGRREAIEVEQKVTEEKNKRVQGMKSREDSLIDKLEKIGLQSLGLGLTRNKDRRVESDSDEIKDEEFEEWQSRPSTPTNSIDNEDGKRADRMKLLDQNELKLKLHLQLLDDEINNLSENSEELNNQLDNTEQELFEIEVNEENVEIQASHTYDNNYISNEIDMKEKTDDMHDRLLKLEESKQELKNRMESLNKTINTWAETSLQLNNEVETTKTELFLLRVSLHGEARRQRIEQAKETARQSATVVQEPARHSSPGLISATRKLSIALKIVQNCDNSMQQFGPALQRIVDQLHGMSDTSAESDSITITDVTDRDETFQVLEEDSAEEKYREIAWDRSAANSTVSHQYSVKRTLPTQNFHQDVCSDCRDFHDVGRESQTRVQIDGILPDLSQTHIHHVQLPPTIIESSQHRKIKPARQVEEIHAVSVTDDESHIECSVRSPTTKTSTRQNDENTTFSALEIDKSSPALWHEPLPSIDGDSQAPSDEDIPSVETATVFGERNESLIHKNLSELLPSAEVSVDSYYDAIQSLRSQEISFELLCDAELPVINDGELSTTPESCRETAQCLPAERKDNNVSLTKDMTSHTENVTSMSSVYRICRATLAPENHEHEYADLEVLTEDYELVGDLELNLDEEAQDDIYEVGNSTTEVDSEPYFEEYSAEDIFNDAALSLEVCGVPNSFEEIPEDFDFSDLEEKMYLESQTVKSFETPLRDGVDELLINNIQLRVDGHALATHVVNKEGCNEALSDGIGKPPLNTETKKTDRISKNVTVAEVLDAEENEPTYPCTLCEIPTGQGKEKKLQKDQSGIRKTEVKVNNDTNYPEIHLLDDIELQKLSEAIRNKQLPTTTQRFDGRNTVNDLLDGQGEVKLNDLNGRGGFVHYVAEQWERDLKNGEHFSRTSLAVLAYEPPTEVQICHDRIQQLEMRDEIVNVKLDLLRNIIQDLADTSFRFNNDLRSTISEIYMLMVNLELKERWPQNSIPLVGKKDVSKQKKEKRNEIGEEIFSIPDQYVHSMMAYYKPLAESKSSDERIDRLEKVGDTFDAKLDLLKKIANDLAISALQLNNDLGSTKLNLFMVRVQIQVAERNHSKENSSTGVRGNSVQSEGLSSNNGSNRSSPRGSKDTEQQENKSNSQQSNNNNDNDGEKSKSGRKSGCKCRPLPKESEAEDNPTASEPLKPVDEEPLQPNDEEDLLPVDEEDILPIDDDEPCTCGSPSCQDLPVQETSAGGWSSWCWGWATKATGGSVNDRLKLLEEKEKAIDEKLDKLNTVVNDLAEASIKASNDLEATKKDLNILKGTTEGNADNDDAPVSDQTEEEPIKYEKCSSPPKERIQKRCYCVTPEEGASEPPEDDEDEEPEEPEEQKPVNRRITFMKHRVELLIEVPKGSSDMKFILELDTPTPEPEPPKPSKKKKKKSILKGSRESGEDEDDDGSDEESEDEDETDEEELPQAKRSEEDENEVPEEPIDEPVSEEPTEEGGEEVIEEAVEELIEEPGSEAPLELTSEPVADEPIEEAEEEPIEELHEDLIPMEPIEGPTEELTEEPVSEEPVEVEEPVPVEPEEEQAEQLVPDESEEPTESVLEVPEEDENEESEQQSEREESESDEYVDESDNDEQAVFSDARVVELASVPPDVRELWSDDSDPCMCEMEAQCEGCDDDDDGVDDRCEKCAEEDDDLDYESAEEGVDVPTPQQVKQQAPKKGSPATLDPSLIKLDDRVHKLSQEVLNLKNFINERKAMGQDGPQSPSPGQAQNVGQTITHARIEVKIPLRPQSAQPNALPQIEVNVLGRVGEQSVLVGWENPQPDAGNVTGYQICVDGEPKQQIDNATRTIAIVPEMNMNTTFTITINALGPGGRRMSTGSATYSP